MSDSASDERERVGPSDARPLVDTTLIDAMLALDPTERLRQNDRTLAMIEALRRGLGTDEPPR